MLKYDKKKKDYNDYNDGQHIPETIWLPAQFWMQCFTTQI